MCGITGLINYGEEIILQKMNNVLAHRGPDDEGIQWWNDHCSGLGHKRLSIIDLSKYAHQPMSNDSGNLWIVYNGELYNYKEIRNELLGKGFIFRSQSDTEVVIKAFEAWGTKCLEKFNGMFSFAIYDTFKHELFAARDRIGIKPFYYYQKRKFLVFASEIKALLVNDMIEKEPDLFSLCTPTRFQISPFTGFKDIYKLPPGHYLTFKNNKLNIQKYWDIEPIEEIRNEEQAIDKLDNLLNDSITLQMVSDVPVGSFLSGGLDSSLITSLMARNTSCPISTFTIKYSAEDQKYEQMSPDNKFAWKVSEYLGTDHHEFEIKPDIVDLLPKMVYHLDEPLADSAAINTYLIAKFAREKGIKVLLNGMGGDEIFGGYRKKLACLKSELYKSYLPEFLREYIENFASKIPEATPKRAFKSIRWGKRFLSLASKPQLERYLMSDLSLSISDYESVFNIDLRYHDTYFFRKNKELFELNGCSYLTKMCLNDTKIFLPEHNLTYSDKSTMAIGVESRPPLTDHRIVEFMFKVVPALRINGSIQKYLLKKVGNKYLPKEIVYRPKAPFGTPLRSWIRGPLKEMIDDYLCEESINKRKIYNASAVRQIIKEDREGIKDNALIIWQFLTNEIWIQTFFDK